MPKAPSKYEDKIAVAAKLMPDYSKHIPEEKGRQTPPQISYSDYEFPHNPTDLLD